MSDVSTAILETKIKNSLVVLGSDARKERVEPYQIVIHPDLGAELQFFHDEPVRVMGKKRRENILVVVHDESIPKHSVVLCKETRVNLRVRINDYVKLYAQEVGKIPRITSMEFYPIEDTMANISGDLYGTYIEPFFRRDIYVSVGNIYKIKSGAMSAIEFKVVSALATVDGEEKEVMHGLVVDDTNVHSEEVVARADVEKEHALIGY
ncbi:transitional endoplasmic reticulum ATPase, partial [Pancytospora philotis]